MRKKYYRAKVKQFYATMVDLIFKPINSPCLRDVYLKNFPLKKYVIALQFLELTFLGYLIRLKVDSKYIFSQVPLPFSPALIFSPFLPPISPSDPPPSPILSFSGLDPGSIPLLGGRQQYFRIFICNINIEKVWVS